jgi:RNA polymerase sigma-70 factor, ECF subfamily
MDERTVADPHEEPLSEAGRGREEDRAVVDRLRAGDEAAFVALVNRHSAAMLRLASAHLPRSAAEEVVQDAWLAVFQEIRRFEGRSSLKTWIFRILMNRSATRAQRERRSVPFSALAREAEEPAEPSVDPSRFLGADHPQWPHHWATPPRSWGDSPEERLLSRESQAQIQQAIDALPPGQRDVITLCDVDGWEPAEVCGLLGITRVNQRVLLHRARSRVRQALEQYFEAT